ncbi:M23 family metallopeptidase [Actinomyces faecalis]|uniref:M23 family metallopeptidase n=1 Tax=Actinomyces faecalis TaxID=2722820 RepID=UPI0015565812|nr:M23 family metallopeptidase [Actinomyces faecalis]
MSSSQPVSAALSREQHVPSRLRLRLLATAVVTVLAAPSSCLSAPAPALPPDAAGPAAASTPWALTTVVLSTAPQAPGAGQVRYRWPTGARAPVLRPFDPPAVRWGPGHRGVDLALTAGSPVLAAGEGTVAFAGTVAGRAVVSVDHADGIRTTYEPVDPVVSAGDHVRAGDCLGHLAPGHRDDGADALHWGARTSRDVYVSPLRLVQPAVIRLKPL